MKQSKKILILVAIALVLVGAGMMTTAMVQADFTFSQISTMKFKETTVDITENFTNIEIRDTESDIRLRPSADGTCKVVCIDSDKITHTAEVKGDTLTITRTDSRKWYEHIGIYWGDFTVTVYLPEAEYNNLYLKSTSGDVEVPSSFTFAKAELYNTSGDIKFEAGVREGVTAKSTSGSLQIRGVKGGPVRAESVSGDIVLENITADSLSVSATSGDLELSTVQVNGEATFKTVSGDIELDRTDAESLYIKTTSGDVKGTLLSGKIFETHTTSGHVQVPASDFDGGHCEIRTTSGDIRIRIAG